MPVSKEKKVIPSPEKNIQFDLFSQFVSNDDNVSNAIPLWDYIPKYFFTTALMKKLRTSDGLSGSYSWTYKYKDSSIKGALEHNFTVKIQPALLTVDGVEKAYFPSSTEEFVEEALKKILADQRYGIHDPKSPETWVRFSISMIRKELKARGRTSSFKRIKHAINVMSGCVFTLMKDGEEVWKGAILQDLVTVNRQEYINDTSSQHVARLPLFVSQSINQLSTRQFNQSRWMECDEQLGRWLYKHLINRYIQASPLNDYHFLFSTIKRDSALLQQGRESDNRRKMISALKELVAKKVLASYEVDEREDKKTNTIEEVKYTVRPTSEFVSEQKAANKRLTANRDVGRVSGILPDGK